MDLLVLVDRLDDLLFGARALPLSRLALVDREAAFGLLDEIRQAVPEEVQAARALLAQEPPPDAGEVVAGAAASHPLADANAQLAQVAAEVADLREGLKPAPPLTAAAVEQVRWIVQAAERAAEEIEQGAREQAERVAAGAAVEARRLREEAAAEATALVDRVRVATASIVQRAERAGAEVDAVGDHLRSAGAELAATASEQSASLRAELHAISGQLNELGGKPQKDNTNRAGGWGAGARVGDKARVASQERAADQEPASANGRALSEISASSTSAPDLAVAALRMIPPRRRGPAHARTDPPDQPPGADDLPATEQHDFDDGDAGPQPG